MFFHFDGIDALLFYFLASKSRNLGKVWSDALPKTYDPLAPRPVSSPPGSRRAPSISTPTPLRALQCRDPAAERDRQLPMGHTFKPALIAIVVRF